MARKLRIGVLLLLLAFVATSAWLARARLADWSGPPHRVIIYPIDAAGTDAVDAYVDGLREADFEPIETWLRHWAEHYRPGIGTPARFELGDPIAETPPEPPRDGGLLATMAWSLHMRYWAWRHDDFDGPVDAHIFVAYHDPRRRERVADSLGLRKGAIGVVNAFGHPLLRGRNRVVIVHEFLHLVGAKDKYDSATGRPLHPAGYADPDREPLHPQQRAEIMGAKIPVSASRIVMPDSLAAAVIGPVTAREIGWSGG